MGSLVFPRVPRIWTPTAVHDLDAKDAQCRRPGNIEPKALAHDRLAKDSNMTLPCSFRAPCTFLYPPKCFRQLRAFSASTFRWAERREGPQFITPRSSPLRSNALAMKEEMEKKMPEDNGLMIGIVFVRLVQEVIDELSSPRNFRHADRHQKTYFISQTERAA